jgi:hypothetical protein
MSAQNPPTAKLTSNDKDKKKPEDEQAAKEVQKPAQPLEEDDEFEDFPVEGTYPS